MERPFENIGIEMTAVIHSFRKNFPHLKSSTNIKYYLQTAILITNFLFLAQKLILNFSDGARRLTLFPSRLAG